MQYTTTQSAKLKIAADELMLAIAGKVPDIHTMKVMSMLNDTFIAGLGPDHGLPEGRLAELHDAAAGAAFVAAIGRNEEKEPPFEYVKRMATALFGTPEESFNAKMRMYEDAVAAILIGKHCIPLDTSGLQKFAEED